MSAVTGELKSPMECAEEGQHDGTVCRLDIQCLVKNRDGDAGVDGRDEACRTPSTPWISGTQIGAVRLTLCSQSRLPGEIHRHARRADIGYTARKTEDDVGRRDGMGDRIRDPKLFAPHTSGRRSTLSIKHQMRRRTYEGLLGRLDVVRVDVPARDGLGEVGGGVPDFLTDVLGCVLEGLRPRAARDRARGPADEELVS